MIPSTLDLSWHMAGNPGHFKPEHRGIIIKHVSCIFIVILISKWCERFELTNQLAGRLQNWCNTWRIKHPTSPPPLLRSPRVSVSLTPLALFSKSCLNCSFSPKYCFRSHLISHARVKQRMTAGKLIADVFTQFWRGVTEIRESQITWIASRDSIPPKNYWQDPDSRIQILEKKWFRFQFHVSLYRCIAVYI